jgi:hypothetical protein
MMRRRKRLASLEVCALEERRLLSGTPVGTWLGQDGHDLVGPSSLLSPDGVQDIHIAITGLPADRTITFADVQGLGGGDWQYNGPWGPWLAAIVRAPGSTSADLYIEPSQKETGRPFSVSLKYDDGSTTGFWLTGGTADPNLRMPDVALQLQWVGQDGHDLAGPGPSVGPDGIQDVHLRLSHLSSSAGIAAVLVTGPNGALWQYGLNALADNNAELVLNTSDRSQADLYMNPVGDLNGRQLTVQVVYADKTTDTAHVLGGPTNPTLAVPPPAPVTLTGNQVAAQWVGQDGQNLVGPGDVHVTLAGLPAGHTMVAATLSDGIAGSWAYQNNAPAGFYADPFALPLAIRSSNASATAADLDFPPIRNEAGTTMSLRLVFDDGTTTMTQFAGASSDPGLRSPAPAVTSVVAHPGDNLNALANQFGSVRLTAGTYNLSQPLILNNPVKITADPGATLVFSQKNTDAPWTAAIKIESGRTTLDGFAVRFATPVRWNLNVFYGPAVIGTTDNLDSAGHNDARAGIVLTHLDLQSPPASSAWEEAPRLIRVVTASGGQIAGNTLKGGTTEFLNGPWQIVNNTYNGTVPNTYSFAAFAGHNTHDLVLTGNTAQPVGASGKTWRFLVLTVSGANDLVANNRVVGIGPQDSDTVPGANAPEIVLTEAYSVHFEGTPAAISPDSRIVQIPGPQGNPARPGDVVSILDGPNAGQWRRITQVISPTAYMLDQPLPQGASAISIATGFVDESFTGNTIDSRGSSVAADLVLAGNHYGTQVVNNHLLGGSQAFLIAAAPTEQPVFWGWTHAPFFGGVIAGNTITDALGGGVLTVSHSLAIKTNKGRVYMSASLTNNTVEWTDAFLAHRTQIGATGPLWALTIGDTGSIDTGELVVQASGNRVRGPAGFAPGASLLVNSATLNGQAQLDQKLTLPTAPPPAPANLRLVNPRGTGANASVTVDGRLQFDPVLGASGYEYRLTSKSTYTSIGTQTSFLPAGLAPGTNTVLVRAFNGAGQRGPDASITFVSSPAVPLSGVWLGQDKHDLVGPWSVTKPDGIQDIHIRLSGLRPDLTVAMVDVEGLGGGQWLFSGPYGPWKAAFIRSPGATTADIYIQPYQVETGRPFSIVVTYSDGTKAGVWVTGGKASPTLHMPSTAPASGSVGKKAASPTALATGMIVAGVSHPVAVMAWTGRALVPAKRATRT